MIVFAKYKFQADTRGQAIWLSSSNINEKFYNSHGFVTVGETTLGDNNPNWDQDPIAVKFVRTSLATRLGANAYGFLDGSGTQKLNVTCGDITLGYRFSATRSSKSHI